MAEGKVKRLNRGDVVSSVTEVVRAIFMKINLNKLGKRERILVAGVVILLLFFSIEHFMLAPFFDKLDSLTIQINAEQDKLKRSRYMNSQEEYIFEAFDKIKPYIEEGKTGETNTASIMKKIEEMAKECGVNLEKMKPEAVDSRDKEKYNIKKLSLSIISSAENIVKFLYKLENSAYPIRIVKMDFKVKDRDKNLMSADFDLYFMYFGNK